MAETDPNSPSEWKKTLWEGAILTVFGSSGTFAMVSGIVHGAKGFIAWLFLLIFGAIFLSVLGYGLRLLASGVDARARHRKNVGAIRIDLTLLHTDGPPWAPTDTVTDHLGRELRSDRDFFMAPPPEIGEVITAFSSLTHDHKPNRATDFVACLVVAAAGFAGFMHLSNKLLPANEVVSYCVGAAGAVLAFFLGRAVFNPRAIQLCSYVGSRGVARFLCRTNRGRITEANVFLFQNAVELRTSTTEVYVNGIYQETVYRFDWFDVDGNVCFQICGKHTGYFLGDHIFKEAPYQWALSAEKAWTLQYSERLREQAALTNSLRFNLLDGAWLAVEPGFLEVHLVDGTAVRCSPEDIETLSLSAGIYTLRLLGSRKSIFSSSGIHTFSHESIANGMLFLLLVESVGGFTVVR
jgi:hypothetical protein